MLTHVILFGAGLAITIVTLLDAFSTVLVPGPVRGTLRTAARISRALLPLARAVAKPRRRPGTRPTNGFAPFLSVITACAWLLLLLIGFGLMFLALADDFEPRLGGIGEAIYVAGSSLMTLGVSEVDAHDGARWLILLAALSGYGVITATIAFIMQVQAGLHLREPQVLTLSGIAGRPPTGVGILETHAELDMMGELPTFFREWRDWSADLLDSHVTYPALALFHSADAEGDWLAALEAVLDAATLLMTMIQSEARGSATLMHRSGARTVSQLCAVFRLAAAADVAIADEDLSSMRRRLETAGYGLADDEKASTERFRTLRADYLPRIRALAEHLGADRTRLLPEHR